MADPKTGIYGDTPQIATAFGGTRAPKDLVMGGPLHLALGDAQLTDGHVTSIEKMVEIQLIRAGMIDPAIKPAAPNLDIIEAAYDHLRHDGHR